MGIPVIAQITRQGGANFPLIAAEDAIGAFVTVASTGARDAIPTNILRTGAIVRIANTTAFYEWNGSAWITFSGFGSSATAIDWKDSVRVATAAAMPASTRVTNTRTANANAVFPTIDGVSSWTVGDRILDKDNATGADRGIWVIVSLGSVSTPWVMARASDADSSSEVTAGMAFAVTEGTTLAGKIFILTTADPIALNTTSLTFTALGTGSTVTAGNGLTGTTTLAVLAADGTITVSGSGVSRAALTGDVTAAIGSNATAIAANAVTTAKILDANVTPAKLSAAATKGASLVWNGTAWVPFGVKTRATDLSDANVTISATEGSRAELPAGTLTANRQAQFNLTGAVDKKIYTVERRDVSAFTYTVKNSLGTPLYTFPVSATGMATFQFTGGEWAFSALADIF